MKNHIRWLREEVDRWVADGLMDAGQAQRIRARYPDPGPGLPWGTIVFSGLGAVIAGLGVILLFAYNWHALPRGAKLAAVFGALAGAHGAGIWLFLRSDRFRALGEALTVLGTMLFGAGIWLVAQIYHIEEHYPNAFIVWGLGALAMAWALRSPAQGVIASALLALWAGVEAGQFGESMHLAAPLLLGLLAPLAYARRSPVLAGAVLISLGVSLGSVCLPDRHGDLVLPMLLSLASAALALKILVQRWNRFPEAAPVLGFLGSGTYIVLLFIFTFRFICKEAFYIGPKLEWENAAMLLFYGLVPAAVNLLLWGAVAWPMRRGWIEMEDCPWDSLLVPLVVLLSQVFTALSLREWHWHMAALFNLIFLAHATSMMVRGVRQASLRLTVQGSLLLGVLILARYFDLFQSLYARGLVFLAVGAAFIVEGVLYARSARRRAAGEGT